MRLLLGLLLQLWISDTATLH